MSAFLIIVNQKNLARRSIPRARLQPVVWTFHSSGQSKSGDRMAKIISVAILSATVSAKKECTWESKNFVKMPKRYLLQVR